MAKVCAKILAKVDFLMVKPTFTQTFAQTFVSFVRTNKFANPASWGTVLDPSAPSKVAKTIKIYTPIKHTPMKEAPTSCTSSQSSGRTPGPTPHL